MKALILAAGIGKRLRPYSLNKPKCLIKVGNKTILEHQFDHLDYFGITKKDVIIITGYKAELIKKFAGDEIKYIHNPLFETTSSLYSMSLAKKEKYDDGLIFMNSDIMFHRKILEKSLLQKANTTTVDYRKKLTDGEMNVIVDENKEKVIEISKEIKAKDADGENAQISKFDKEGSKIIFKEIGKALKESCKNQFPACLFKYIIDELGLYAIDTEGLPWVEIDHPEDLFKAKEINWN